jgi:2-C-methyl-D-erythritol 4-phosphate cytidylyltransferase
MKSTLSAVVVAAGESQRFRSNPKFPGLQPKTLIEWEAKPLFIHTLEALSDALDLQEIILVRRASDDLIFKRAIEKSSKLKSQSIKLVDGGALRRDSVRNGLEALKPCGRAAIHDAARPFISKDLLQELDHQSLQHKAVIPVVPIAETVKEVGTEGIVKKTHPRQSLVRVQTPQIFDYEMILKINQELAEDPTEFTDDAMMCEAKGIEVKTCAGDLANIKVTTPEDLIQLGLLEEAEFNARSA